MRTLAVIIISFCFMGIAEAGIKEDIELCSFAIKDATLYSVKENQVQAGFGIELANYKKKLNLDFLVGPPKQTLALGLAYEADLIEYLLGLVNIKLPEALQGNIQQSLGVDAGFRGVGSENCDFDYGIYGTILKYRF